MHTFIDSHYHCHSVADIFPIVTVLNQHALLIWGGQAGRYILLCACLHVQCLHWLRKSCVTLLSASQAVERVTDVYSLVLGARLIIWYNRQTL